MKDYQEKKEYLYHQQSGRCASCKRHLVHSDKLELSHKIQAYKANYKKYGEEVIDHVINLALTHSNKCNDKQNLSIAANPVAANELIEKIKLDILAKS